MITCAFSGRLKMYNCCHNYFCAYTKQYIIIFRRHFMYNIIIIWPSQNRTQIRTKTILIDPTIRFLFFFPLTFDNIFIFINYNLLKSKYICHTYMLHIILYVYYYTINPIEWLNNVWKKLLRYEFFFNRFYSLEV